MEKLWSKTCPGVMVPREEAAPGSAGRILDLKCHCKAVYVHNIWKLVEFGLSADYIFVKGPILR